MSTKPMTPKQQRFCDEFMLDCDATKAAQRAGYSKKTAGQIGYQQLQKTSVVDRIAELRRAQEKRTLVSADQVIRELALLGFANMQDYVQITDEGEPFIDLSELTREQAAAISEVVVEDFKDGRGSDARDIRKVRFKLHDKRGPLTDLGKHFGIFGARGTEDDPHHHKHEHIITDDDRQRRLEELRKHA